MGAHVAFDTSAAALGVDDAGSALDALALGAGASRRVPRPHIPPLLIAALSLWAACAALLTLFSSTEARAFPIAAASGTAAMVSAVCALRFEKRRAVLLVLLGAAMGAFIASSYACHLAGLEAAIDETGQLIERRFLVVEDPSSGAYGKSCFARTVDERGGACLVRLNLDDSADVACWDVLQASASISPGAEGSRAYLWRHGAVGQATVRGFTKVRTEGPLAVLASVRNGALALYAGRDDDGAALMRALLFGKRDALFQSDAYDAIKRDGIAHMVAVSGAHLAVVSGFVAMALRALHLRRRATIAVMAVFIACYIVLTGAPVSALRAGAMTAASMSSFFAKRRSAPASALGVVVICFIALSPSCALSLSFALSALATLGIALFARYFSAWAQAMFADRARALADALGLTCAANMYTLPLSVPMFGQFSLVAPLANALCGPLFSVLCVGGMACTVLAAAVRPLQGALLDAACNAGQGFCELAEILATVPCAGIAASGNAVVLLAAAAVASAVLLWAWPVPRGRRGWAAVGAACAFLTVAVAVLPLSHGSEIIMLDVGQGDAFVLRSGAVAVMVDTGTNDAQVLQGLARNDVRSLQALIITHHDDDHCGSLKAVRDYVAVERVCVAQDVLSCGCANCVQLRRAMEGVDVVPLRAGDELAFGPFSAKVLSPASFTEEGGNQDSVVMRVCLDADADASPEVSALFTGDAEAEVLDGLVRRGLLSPVDILKVPHHGSRAGLDDEVMEALHPQLALISVGEGNRYGHPTQETLDRLHRFGCTVERTDAAGDVVCSLDGSAVRVRSQKVE